LEPHADQRQGAGQRVETALLCVLLLGIVVIATLQIVLRNFFSYSLFWADELIRLAVLWLAMVGGVAASRDRRHIAVGIVERYFPRAWHRPAAVTAVMFASLVCAALAWQGYRFVADSHAYADTVLDGWPAWVFQAVIPAGFGLMSYRFARQALELTRRPRA
jgi:TRAP-type C4-dicarboxylate transport system permease small subunit